MPSAWEIMFFAFSLAVGAGLAMVATPHVPNFTIAKAAFVVAFLVLGWMGVAWEMKLSGTIPLRLLIAVLFGTAVVYGLPETLRWVDRQREEASAGKAQPAKQVVPEEEIASVAAKEALHITRDKDGLVTEVRDDSGTRTNVYYPSQKLKSTTVNVGASKTITYQYNDALLVSSMQRSGESAFSYTYNGRNQLSSITDPNSVQVSFTYDNAGRRTRITGPGSYVEYVYNDRNWITEVHNRKNDDTPLYDATYSYQDGSLWDHTGNPLKRVETLSGLGTYTTTLRYDAASRETEETKRDSSNTVVYSLGYGYDACGNRTSRTVGGVTTNYGYDNNNKLTTVNSVTSCSYDGSGNLTSTYGNLPSQTMVYGDENYLTSITYGSPSTTDLYYYTYTGLRYRSRLGGTYSRYLYNGERVLEELNDTGGLRARYTTENGSYSGMLLHFYRPTGALNRFPMYDSIGSVRGLADETGAVTDTYELDTFGKTISSTGTTSNPYRYGGAWGYITDRSGMLQLGVRYYWPEAGRFLQQDPLRDVANRCVYVSDNPLTGVDPTGLASTGNPFGPHVFRTFGCYIGCIVKFGFGTGVFGLAAKFACKVCQAALASGAPAVIPCTACALRS